MNFKNQQVPVSSSFLFLAHINLVLSGFENRRASEMNCRRHERHPPFYFILNWNAVILSISPVLAIHFLWPHLILEFHSQCACEYTLERLSKGTCTCTCNREYPHNFCVLRHQFCSVLSSKRSEKLVAY
jgi:hypothetical protein